MNSNKIFIAGIGALVLTAAVLGGSTITHLASAADDATVTPQTTKQPSKDSGVDSVKGGHIGANGVKEELLTGTTAEKVTAAALAAVPGATVERVETDAEGSPYEAHMKKSDGSRVTVKFDSSFKVTSTESGKR